MHRLSVSKVALWACVCLVLLATACRATTDGETAVLLNDTFTLGYGQTAVLQAENLRLTFDAVLEDSRCPTQVQCFWTGQARVTLIAQQGDAAPVTLEFNTNPAPGETVLSAPFGSYQIDLQSLDPYPQDPDKPSIDGEYRVTLQVSQP